MLLRLILFILWSMPIFRPVQVRVYLRMARTTAQWPQLHRSHFMMTAWRSMSNNERWFCLVKGYANPISQEIQDALQDPRGRWQAQSRG